MAMPGWGHPQTTLRGGNWRILCSWCLWRSEVPVAKALFGNGKGQLQVRVRGMTVANWLRMTNSKHEIWRYRRPVLHSPWRCLLISWLGKSQTQTFRRNQGNQAHPNNDKKKSHPFPLLLNNHDSYMLYGIWYMYIYVPCICLCLSFDALL